MTRRRSTNRKYGPIRRRSGQRRKKPSAVISLKPKSEREKPLASPPCLRSIFLSEDRAARGGLSNCLAERPKLLANRRNASDRGDKLPEPLSDQGQIKRGPANSRPSLTPRKTLYGVQTRIPRISQPWHHCPYWHSTGWPVSATPQKHVVVACWLTVHSGTSASEPTT